MPDQAPGSIPFDVNDLTDIFKPAVENPEASVPVPDTPFSQWYGQTVKDKLSGNSSDAIYKKKVDDYFRDMGATPGTKKGTIMNALKEMSASYEASRHKEKYVPLNDRLHSEADTEYQKNEGLYRQEAGTVAQNERADATNRRAVEVQKLKNQASAAKDRNVLQVAALKNNISAIHEAALGNKENAAADYTRLKTRLEEEVAKKYGPGWKNMDKVTQKMIVDQDLQKTLGPDAYKKMLETEQLTLRMQQKPDDKASYVASQPQDYQDAFNKEHGQMEADKLKGKYAPGSGGSRSGSGALIRVIGPDGKPTFATKDEILASRGANPFGLEDMPGQSAVAQAGPRARPLQPYDAFNERTKNAFQASRINSRAVVANALATIKEGKEGEFMSMSEGNSFMKFLRSNTNFVGDSKSLHEVTQNITMSNTNNLHALAVRGGRFSDQQADAMAKALVGDMGNPKSVVRAYAANMLLVELQEREKIGDIDIKDITPALFSTMSKRIEQMINEAYAARGTNYEIKIPDLDEMMTLSKRVSQVVPGLGATTPGKKQKTVDDMINDIGSRKAAQPVTRQ